jgi:hypothetical protein
MTKILAPRAVPVPQDVYIYPPRTKDPIPYADAQIFRDLGWVAQLKYNDSRCLIKYLPGDQIELWNRHAEKFRTYRAPDFLLEELRGLRRRLGLSTAEMSLLDGGLIDHKHPALNDVIAVWDVLVLNGKHLIGTAYEDRWALLDAIGGEPWLYTGKGCEKGVDFGKKIDDHLLVPRNYRGDEWDSIWNDLLPQVNAYWTVGKPGDKDYDCRPLIEGLVYKNPKGKLGMGFREQNNGDWMAKSRVQTRRHRF